MSALRRLYGYLRPYRSWAMLAFASMVIVALTQGALVALSQPLCDEVLTRKGAQAQVVPTKKSRAIDYILNRDKQEGRRGTVVNAIDDVTRPARSWWVGHEKDRWRYIPFLLLFVFVIRAITAFFSEYAFQKV